MRPRAKAFARALGRAGLATLNFTRTDGLMLCGAAVVASGAWMLYEPLGVIVAGVALIGLGWMQGAQT